MTTLLIADDEQTFLDFMVRLLQKEHELLIARNWNEVLEKYESNLWRLNATILDVNMPGLNVDPYTMVNKLLNSNTTVPMIVISGQDIVLRHEFLKMGVFQYHGKPIDIVDLKLSIQSALTQNRILRRLNQFEKNSKEECKYFQTLLNINSAELKNRISSYDTELNNTPILIQAEAGGKPEMLARLIHQEMDGGLFFSKVCDPSLKNIIPYNIQNNDTLFLEGIENLAENEIKALTDLFTHHNDQTNGSSANFRLILSGSEQVERNSSEATELSHLLESLNPLDFRIEPLRLRKHEIKEIIDTVLQRKKKERYARADKISDSLYELLCEYNWPLNFDELDLILECLLITCQEPVLRQKHLHQLDFSDMAHSKYPTLDDMVEQHIKKALRLTRGNKSRAARMLGITPKTLYARIRN